MLPWLIFSFMGTVDLGFATYALISLESAARVAAAYAAYNIATMEDAMSPGGGKACTYALAEMRNAPNVGSGVTTCGAGDPVQFAAAFNNPGSDGVLRSVTVTVTYTIHLLALPAIMPSQVTITRQVEFPIRG